MSFRCSLASISSYDAYQLHGTLARRPVLGGVLIAERHAARADEHQRMLRKQVQGCRFFVSQVCYDLDHVRNLLSDYAYTCRDEGIDPCPTVLTLAPCGSATGLPPDSPGGALDPAKLEDQPLLVLGHAAAGLQDRPQRDPVELAARHFLELSHIEDETHRLASLIAFDLRIDCRQSDQASPVR